MDQSTPDRTDWASRFVEGFEIWHAPLDVAAVFWSGWIAREPEVEALERKLVQIEARADQLYERLFNPGRKLRDTQLDRIDDALEVTGDRGELRSIADDVRVAVEAAVAPKQAA